MSLRPRLVAAGGLLFALALAYEVLGDLYAIPIALLLMGLPVVQWAVFGFFYRRSRERPDNIVLQVRAQDALSGAIAQSVGALLGLIVMLRLVELIPSPGPGIYAVGLSFLAIMIAAPALNAALVWRPWARTVTVPLEVEGDS